MARVEVVRAVLVGGPAAVALARRQLGRFDQLTLDGTLLDRAATLAAGGVLRSLDAIHLAAAERSALIVRAVVSYKIDVCSKPPRRLACPPRLVLTGC